MESFKKEYDHYLVALEGGTTDEGITLSWFKCAEALQDEHCIMINSFGVDTRKLLVKTVEDERQVLQLAVGFKHWDPKDVGAFEKMYGVKLCQQELLGGLEEDVRVSASTASLRPQESLMKAVGSVKVKRNNSSVPL